MKEVTEWDNRPRYMWCWDNDVECKEKAYVLYILTEEEMKEFGVIYPVSTHTRNYKHCAEIEEDKE